MTRRPRSHPDYQWPASFLTPIRLPVRLLFAGVFYFAYAIGRFARHFSGTVDQLCVIRTDGIGDAVLFEPALRSLAERFPGKQIHLWAPAATCELLDSHPQVAQSAAIPRGAKGGNLGYFHSFLWRAKVGYLLARWSFDLAIYPAHSPEPLGNWVFESIDAREKWLNYGDTENQFDWQRDRTAAAATRVPEPRASGGHELLRNAHLASQWGGDISDDWPQINILAAANQAAADQVRQWWQAASRAGATQLVGVMPVSAMAVKGYPLASWSKMIADLWRTRRAMCVLLGGPADSKVLDELSKSLSDVPHARLSSGAGLLTVAGILPRLDALLSVDTGLAHMAIAQDVPTVVLRTGGHPGRFFPWPAATRSIALNKPMPCEGCRCRCVLAEAECVTRIQPGEIIAAYLRLTHRVPDTVAA
jgi:ADP-heptose:LPS heptosyltransferase